MKRAGKANYSNNLLERPDGHDIERKFLIGQGQRFYLLYLETDHADVVLELLAPPETDQFLPQSLHYDMGGFMLDIV